MERDIEEDLCDVKILEEMYKLDFETENPAIVWKATKGAAEHWHRERSQAVISSKGKAKNQTVLTVPCREGTFSEQYENAVFL